MGGDYALRDRTCRVACALCKSGFGVYRKMGWICLLFPHTPPPVPHPPSDVFSPRNLFRLFYFVSFGGSLSFDYLFTAFSGIDVFERFCLTFQISLRAHLRRSFSYYGSHRFRGSITRQTTYIISICPQPPPLTQILFREQIRVAFTFVFLAQKHITLLSSRLSWATNITQHQPSIFPSYIASLRK